MHKPYKKHGKDSHSNNYKISSTNDTYLNEKTYHQHHRHNRHRSKNPIICEREFNDHYRSKRASEKDYQFYQHLDHGDNKVNKVKNLEAKLLAGHEDVIFISPDNIRKFERKHQESKHRSHHGGDGKTSYLNGEKVKNKKLKSVLSKDVDGNQCLVQKPISKKENKSSKEMAHHLIYQNYHKQVDTKYPKESEVEGQTQVPEIRRRRRRHTEYLQISPDQVKDIQERIEFEKNAANNSKKDKNDKKSSRHKHSDNTRRRRHHHEENKGENLGESSKSKHVNFASCIRVIPTIITKKIEEFLKIFDDTVEETDNQKLNQKKHHHHRVHVRKIKSLEPKISVTTKHISHNAPVVLPTATPPRLDKVRRRHKHRQRSSTSKHGKDLVGVPDQAKKQIANKSVSTDSKINCSFRTLDRVNMAELSPHTEKKKKLYVCENIPIVQIEPEIFLDEKLLLQEKPPHILELKAQEDNIIELFRFNQYYKYLNFVEKNKVPRKCFSDSNRVNNQSFTNTNITDIRINKFDNNTPLLLSPKVSNTSTKKPPTPSVTHRSQIPIYKKPNLGQSNKVKSINVEAVYSNTVFQGDNNKSNLKVNGREVKSLNKTSISNRPIIYGKEPQDGVVSKKSKAKFVPNTKINKLNVNNSDKSGTKIDDKPKRQFLRRKSVRLTLNNKPKKRLVRFDNTEIMKNSKLGKTPNGTTSVSRTEQKPKSSSLISKWINQEKIFPETDQNKGFECDKKLPPEQPTDEDELKIKSDIDDNSDIKEECETFSKPLKSFAPEVTSFSFSSDLSPPSSPSFIPRQYSAIKRLPRRISLLDDRSSPDSFTSPTSTSMLLTKNYRKPFQVDKFQKRKSYGDAVRENFLRKKHSLSTNNSKKNLTVPQVFEVRYVTEVKVVSSENDKFSQNNQNILKTNSNKIGSFMRSIRSDISAGREKYSKNRRKYLPKDFYEDGSGEFELFFPTSNKDYVVTTNPFPNYYNFYYNNNIFDEPINYSTENVKCYNSPPLLSKKAHVMGLKKQSRKTFKPTQEQSHSDDSLMNILNENCEFLNKNFSMNNLPDSSPDLSSRGDYSISQSSENVSTSSLASDNNDLGNDNINFLSENNSQIIYQNNKFSKTYQKPDGTIVTEQQENVDNNCGSSRESGYATKTLNETPSPVNSVQKPIRKSTKFVTNALNNAEIMHNLINQKITNNLLNSYNPTNDDQACCKLVNKKIVSSNATKNTLVDSNVMSNTVNSNNMISNTLFNKNDVDRKYLYKSNSIRKLQTGDKISFPKKILNNDAVTDQALATKVTSKKSGYRKSNLVKNPQTEHNISFPEKLTHKSLMKDIVTDHTLATTVTSKKSDDKKCSFQSNQFKDTPPVERNTSFSEKKPHKVTDHNLAITSKTSVDKKYLHKLNSIKNLQTGHNISFRGKLKNSDIVTDHTLSPTVTSKKSIDKACPFKSNSPKNTSQTQHNTSFPKKPTNKDIVTDHILVTPNKSKIISSNTFDFLDKLMPSQKFMKLIDQGTVMNPDLSETPASSVTYNISNNKLPVTVNNVDSKILRDKKQDEKSKSKFSKRRSSRKLVTYHPPVAHQNLVSESSQATSDSLLVTDNNSIITEYSPVTDRSMTTEDYPVTDHSTSDYSQATTTENSSVTNHFPIINEIKSSDVKSPESLSKNSSKTKFVTDTNNNKNCNTLMPVTTSTVIDHSFDNTVLDNESKNFNKSSVATNTVTDQSIETNKINETMVTDEVMVTNKKSTNVLKAIKPLKSTKSEITDNVKTTKTKANDSSVTDKKTKVKSFVTKSKILLGAIKSNKTKMATKQSVEAGKVTKTTVPDNVPVNIVTDQSAKRDIVNKTSVTDNVAVNTIFDQSEKIDKVNEVLVTDSVDVNIVTDELLVTNKVNETVVTENVAVTYQSEKGDNNKEIFVTDKLALNTVNKVLVTDNVAVNIVTHQSIETDKVSESTITAIAMVTNRKSVKGTKTEITGIIKATETNTTGNTVTDKKRVSKNRSKSLLKSIKSSKIKVVKSKMTQGSFRSSIGEISITRDPSINPIFNQLSSSSYYTNSTSLVESESKLNGTVGLKADQLLENFSQYPLQIGGKHDKKNGRNMKCFFLKMFQKQKQDKKRKIKSVDDY